MTDDDVRFSSNGDADDVEAVLSGLDAYNEARVGPSRFRKVRLFLRDATGRVRGGLFGRHVWDWLHVEILWVDEPLRRKGLGTQLLMQAEKEAVEAGCTRALLDTFEFQAPAFYGKRGYSVFAVLEDFPLGYRRYYLQKELVM